MKQKISISQTHEIKKSFSNHFNFSLQFSLIQDKETSNTRFQTQINNNKKKQSIYIKEEI